jgi:hypothetical protein
MADVVVAAHGPEHRQRVRREFVANALYVDLVILAGLVVVPADEIPEDRTEVAVLILGGSFGLLAAHWLAFRLAVQVTTVGNWHKAASQEAAAQLAGGLGVAVLAVLPFLVFSGTTALRGALVALVAPLVAVGLAIGRLRGLPWFESAIVALIALLVSGVVVGVKIGVGH